MFLKKLFFQTSPKAKLYMFQPTIENTVFHSWNSKLLSKSSSSPHSFLFRLYTSVSTQFEEAKLKLSSLQNDPGNEVKLEMYALFKQATIGKNETSRPGTFNFVGQAKWNAWNDLADMSKDEAMQKYVDIVNSLVAKEKPENMLSEDNTGSHNVELEGMTMTTENKVTTITLNRPDKKNALTTNMYGVLSFCLDKAAKDEETSIVVITGAGDYYCSGNDLNNFMNIDPKDMKKHAEDGGVVLKKYVASFIDFPKPLVAAVNGPAFGVTVTTLGLFDLVFASDKATFSTPFSTLGQSPEGCASYTFPMIMGHSKACQMMLFNRKLSADEAEKVGLVTRVFPDNVFRDAVSDEVTAMAQLPLKSLVYSKELMRSPIRQALHDANARECDRLVERWTSEDCINAIMSFFANKTK